MRNGRLFIYLLLLTLCSCKAELRELCYDHNHWNNVSITFDWKDAPTAQTKGMTTLFFNQQELGSEPERYDFPGRYGGSARLKGGTYRAVAYNYDTETIRYRGMDAADNLQAYTRQSSIEEGTQLTRAGMPRAVGTEQEIVILEPDTLWAAASEQLVLEGIDNEVGATLYPSTRVCQVEIDIHNVPNLQYTGQFGGALSGLVPGVMVASGQLLDGCVTEAFTCQKIDETTLQMKFRIFGHCPHRDEGQVNPHLLTIYAILADGSKWYYTQDVTDQMHDKVKNPDVYHIFLDLDDLPIPKPIVNGSGFQPTIDGWQGIEIDVGM